MGKLVVSLKVKPTIYAKILLKTLSILVYCNLLSGEDASEYYLSTARYKMKIDKGKWKTINLSEKE